MSSVRGGKAMRPLAAHEGVAKRLRRQNKQRMNVAREVKDIENVHA